MKINKKLEMQIEDIINEKNKITRELSKLSRPLNAGGLIFENEKLRKYIKLNIKLIGEINKENTNV